MTRDEMRAIVRRDYADRVVRDIADELGLTRSAVIGMAHRMGLRARRPNRGGNGRGRKRKPAVTVRPQLSIVRSQALLDLHADACRWPLDGDLFCGAPATREHYCATHWHRAHVRRDQRWATTSASRSTGG